MENIYKILGSGCANCQKLEENLIKALEESNSSYKIEHVKDFVEIAKYGVMRTPALVKNNKVLSTGRVMSIDELKKIIN